MKQFNYNPFTWEPKENSYYWYLDSDEGVTQARYKSTFLDIKRQMMTGFYRTHMDANLALEIAREAIVNNVKE